MEKLNFIVIKSLKNFVFQNKMLILCRKVEFYEYSISQKLN